MKAAQKIELGKGNFALISADDWEELSKWKWSSITDWIGRTYAVRYSGRGEHRKTIYMHREIMMAPAGLEVDHRDGDGLNNFRENLRLATRSENMRNKGLQRNNTSGYKGVSWRKQKKKWEAYIKLNGRVSHLGYFSTAESAHEAYCKAAVELHGEFARVA